MRTASDQRAVTNGNGETATTTCERPKRSPGPHRATKPPSLLPAGRTTRHYVKLATLCVSPANKAGTKRSGEQIGHNVPLCDKDGPLLSQWGLGGAVGV